ncbi:unnamed protein product [Chironomus riparius]|uniref:Uncharacterized protein n=1 Tax=Chironomus riparius TaxID=315576 RepID=A0A9N9RMB5_9DIPT|nr:unnamed protein product [Chironomus riparius]
MEMHVENDIEEECTFFMEVDEPRSATIVTKNIDYLNYRDRHRTQDENKRFIDMFPNIKHLSYHTLHKNDFQMLNYICATKADLEFLEVFNFHDDEEAFTIYFPNLKKLKVYDVGFGEDSLCSFICRHSKTLEEINISNANEMTELTGKKIINCNNLKLISLGINTNKLQTFMNMFNVMSTTDKPLMIIFGKLKYKFSEDKIFWDDQLKSFVKLGLVPVNL